MRQLIALPFFLLSSFGGADELQPVDYRIYSTVVDRAVGATTDSLFVVIDSTESKGLVTAGLRTELMRRHFGIYSSIYESTLDDFIAKNQKSVSVEGKPFNSVVRVKIAANRDLPTSDTIDPKNPNEFWNQFRRKYPGARGVLRLSRPGFDEKKKYAIVYYRLSCGTLCGKVGYVLLRRSGESWNIVQQVTPIIS